MTTLPSPAALPGAGIPHLQAAARRFAEANVALSHAAPAELERLAAEQGVEPVTDGEDVAAPLREALTDDEFDAFQAAIHGRDDTPPRRPVPAPPPVQPHRPLTREQYIRRFCLEYAVRYFTGLAESDENDVFTAAKTWAHWVQTGA